MTSYLSFSVLSRGVFGPENDSTLTCTSDIYQMRITTKLDSHFEILWTPNTKRRAVYSESPLTQHITGGDFEETATVHPRRNHCPASSQWVSTDLRIPKFNRGKGYGN